MDASLIEQARQIYERRQAAADAKRAEWAKNPPVDVQGNPLPQGEPLVNIPLVLHRQLVAAAQTKHSDGPEQMQKLADLVRGARLADSPLVAIQLIDLKFLLDRLDAE